MLDESKAMDTLREMINLMNESEKNNCILIDELKDLENKQMDISHLIELDNTKSDERKIKLFNCMEDIRKKRRIIKDNIDFNYEIKKFSKDNKQIKQQINDLINCLEKKLWFRKERVYHARTDIVDEFAQ